MFANLEVRFYKEFCPKLENAMKYVAKNRYGYISELKPYGDETVNFMKSIGFLKTGYTREAETFGATNFLDKNVEVLFGKDNLIKRITTMAKNFFTRFK